MVTSIFPSIFVPLVGLVFPLIVSILFFIYVEKETEQ